MKIDRTASTVERQRPPKALATLSIRLATGLLLLMLAAPAEALIVGTTPNVVPNTSQNPASTAGWVQGDPGWNNSVRFGYLQPNGQIYYQTNGVYIGDGWVLTAAHVGIPTNVLFESGATFTPVPHPVAEDQSYQIANPTWNDSRLVQTLADLRLIRINGDPGVPSVNIATQPLTQNDQLVIMGGGVNRQAAESHFLANKAGNPWTWTTVGSCSGTNCYGGYFSNGNDKHWGTNRIANSDTILGESDGNLQTIVNGGSIAVLTTYDQGGDTFEAQTVGGDSGSPAFFKRAGQWQLAGITLANYAFSGQNNLDPSNTMAMYGNASAFADLSVYNAPGNSQIAAVMNAHQDYSLVGDLNLDGVAGTAADLSAFVAGWRYNNGTGAGTITSWKSGDVTHDGKTDVNDFLRFRTGLSAGAGAELLALMSSNLSGGIPEPSTAMLIIGPVIVFALRLRSRQPRLAA